jgi:hypothetical protein
MVMPGAKEL